jgi:Ca2+-transporting ATPase
VVDRGRWTLIGILGGLITLATLGAFIGALYWLDLGADRAISVAFATLALAQLWNVFNVRDPSSSILANDVTRNAYVWGALVLCLGLIATALWLPGLSGLLQLPSPGAKGVLLAAAFSLAPIIHGQVILPWLPQLKLAGLAPRHEQQATP